jgi:hypothetical protein
MDAFACEMTSDFNKETVKREPLIATGAPLKHTPPGLAWYECLLRMHDASSQLRVGPLLDRTDDREKDARMKLLDRRISVAPMMDWGDDRSSSWLFTNLLCAMQRVAVLSQHRQVPNRWCAE